MRYIGAGVALSGIARAAASASGLLPAQAPGGQPLRPEVRATHGVVAPRFGSLHPESSFGDHRAQRGVLEVAVTLPAATMAELEARGHVLRRRPAYGISTGVVAAGVDAATGRLRGGADPRRERALVAW